MLLFIVVLVVLDAVTVGGVSVILVATVMSPRLLSPGKN